MNKKYTRVLCVFIIAVITLAVFAPAREVLGDFGGFSGGSDYDRGGSSGGGNSGGWSSGSSSSGGWNSGGSSSGWNSGGSSSGWNSGGSSSWNGGSSSNSSWDDDDSGSMFGSAIAGYLIGSILGDDTDDIDDSELFAEIIAIIFVLFILYKAFQSTKGSKSRRGHSVDMPRVIQKANLRPMSEYQSLDPNFDEAMFNAWVAKVYVQLQDAWQLKDLEPVRPYLADAIFNQMDGGLDLLRKRHYTNYIENISVLGVDLQGFTQKGGLDCITARVTTRITDYTLDDATGKLVSGDRKREKFMEYEWELVRKSGVITSKTSKVKAETCPHCGAPIDKNASMKCAYCGSILTAASEEWTISNMQGISQRTK